MKQEKRNKNKKVSEKKFVSIGITIILLIILIFLFQKVYDILLQKKNFENSIISFANKNKETVFSINRVVFFSSSDSKNKYSSLTNFTIENLYTYTDIALFIDNNSEQNTLENTLKSVKISNIKFTKEPKIGQPSLYYKSINDFAKSNISESNVIKTDLEFEITSEDEVNLDKPILYNNCANPITLSYINQNIKTDYTITDVENSITYDGTLLKRCGISIDSLETAISFDINIENNKNQKFRTTVYFNIPYEKGEKSIFDGSMTIKEDLDFSFYRYE